jgi:ParB family transcriptional regulator, chromosome partitioning protein
MTRPSGLGRGLGALIPSAGPGTSGYLTLKLTSIVPNPRQPRGDFAEEQLAELAHSLREVGMLQPILVRAVAEERYEIIAGERRYRAARLAGLDEVPAILRDTADDQLLTEALVENIHRHDLNPLEEAAAYQQLLEDFGMTHDQLAQRLGRSRPGITNVLRLLNLPTAIQQRLAEGTLSAGHARALLGLEDSGLQERAAQRIVAEGLSVRATEELVRKLAEQADAASSLSDLAQAAKDRNRSPYEGLQRRIADALATRVRIRGTPRRGRIVIDYAGQSDLERLLGVLSRGTGEDLLTE